MRSISPILSWPTRRRNRAGEVDERSRVRDAEIRAACHRACAPDAFDDRHGGRRYGFSRRIERHREQRAAQRIDEMAGREITRVAAAATSVLRSPISSDCATICALSHRSGLVPVASVNSSVWPSGQHLRTSANFVRFHAARAISGLPPFAETRMMPVTALAEDDAARPQLIPKGSPAGQMVTAAPAADGDLLERPVGMPRRRSIGRRGEHWIQHAETFRALYRLASEIATSIGGTAG